MFGVLYALLRRTLLFPRQAYRYSILLMLSRPRSTWGFCCGDSACQYVQSIFPPFYYWFYWDDVLSI